MNDEQVNEDKSPAVLASDAVWSPAPTPEPEQPWWAVPSEATPPAEAPAAAPSPEPGPAYEMPRYGAPEYSAPQYSAPDAPRYGGAQYGGAHPQYGQASPYGAPAQPLPVEQRLPNAYGSADPYAPPGGPPAAFPFSTPYPGVPADSRSSRGARRSGWPALLAVAGIASLVGALVAGGLVAASKKSSPSATSAPTTGRDPQPAVNLPAGSLAQIARTLLPSVVSIIVTAGGQGDEGTGIVLSPDGNILTNNHVVESAATSGIIAVTLNDGRAVKATIVGRDPTTDLAVIKAAGVTDLQPAILGQDASLTVGQQVIAIGSPLGLSNTVTSGIISSLNRPVCTQNCGGGSGANAPTPTVLNAIQTDAAINPGNSGGPLVDLSGRVVGVNSAIATLDQGLGGSNAQTGSIGVGFAIPIDEARRVVDELEKTGHANHATLGIALQDSVNDTLHTPNGARVVKVNQGGPAEKAGLRVDDVVVKFGTRTIVDADSLIAATHAAAPNATIAITYSRNGKTSTVQLTLGSAASS
jgi:putative serine protease PepD